jgi:hypothetical protein
MQDIIQRHNISSSSFLYDALVTILVNHLFLSDCIFEITKIYIYIYNECVFNSLFPIFNRKKTKVNKYRSPINAVSIRPFISTG